MKDYLKKHTTQAAYTTWAQSNDFVTPNVSLIEATRGLVYQSYVKPTQQYIEIAGIKWAIMNYGAESITDLGTKYTNYPNSDVITTSYGNNWHTASSAEFDLLTKNSFTSISYISDYNNTGITGILITDKYDNTKQLFFPVKLDKNLILYTSTTNYDTYRYIYLCTMCNDTKFPLISTNSTYYEESLENFDDADAFYIRGVYNDIESAVICTFIIDETTIDENKLQVACYPEKFKRIEINGVAANVDSDGNLDISNLQISNNELTLTYILRIPKHIEDGAFTSLYGLKSCIIPSTVDYIGYQAFDESSRLETLTVLNPNPPHIDGMAFGYTNLSYIYVPSESVNIYKTDTFYNESSEQNELTEWGANYSSIISSIPE